MSGFAGAISAEGAVPDRELLERMAAKLAFRGPDATQVTTQTGVGFCFTLMRTGPAPQAETQPCTLDGKVWLLGDVRLDGRDDLRRKLEQFGQAIPADVTDEELTLRAWQQWGEAGLPDLLGDYSFGLWDSEEQALWCARDLMGARPFFYACAERWLWFSNTLDAIHCVRDVSSELDMHFIGDFLLEGACLHQGRTAFRDIARLPAGHMLRYSRSGLNVRRVASFPIDEPLRLRKEEEYAEQFRSLLEQAVRERLPTGPAAILMSGGLDSSSVAAIASHVAKKTGNPLDLRAYTTDWNPLFKDPESALATLASQYIGIPIEIQKCAGYLPFGGWEHSPPPLPEPFHEPFRAVYVDQMRQVAKHGRVVLNGYGGDGVLTGRSWPYLVDLFVQRRFGMIVRVWGKYFLKRGRLPPLRAGFRSALQRWVEPIDPMANYPVWLVPRFETQFGLRERWKELAKPEISRHPWYPVSHAILNGPFWPNLLEHQDAQSVERPYESRTPLLDVRIQRFLLTVPPVPLCTDKDLFRRSVKGLLPEKIRSRRKTPFGGDPLALQVKNRSWHPLPLCRPTDFFQSVIRIDRLEEVLESSESFYPWGNLHPVSLLYWLTSPQRKTLIR